mgnify:CR=1 FL=1
MDDSQQQEQLGRLLVTARLFGVRSAEAERRGADGLLVRGVEQLGNGEPPERLVVGLDASNAGSCDPGRAENRLHQSSIRAQSV